MRSITNAIVTGPTGAIGTALCKLLRSKGAKVYAIVHPGSVRMSHLMFIEGVQIVTCDLRKLSFLPDLLSCTYADAFFHLAWANTIGRGRNDMDSQVDNIRFTIDSCRVAKRLDCQVFVGAGSQAEYGRSDQALTSQTPCFPENGYGMAKLCAGQMSRAECRKLGIDHIWPRILSVYGPYDGPNAMIPWVIKKLLLGERPSLTSGNQIWDYLYATDAAEALYRMAVRGKDGSVYPLGSGDARPLREYIEVLRDTIDPALQLGFGEIPYDVGQVRHLEADISELEEDTGFRPRVSFNVGIRKTIQYMMEHLHE